MKYYFIINPSSQSGQGVTTWRQQLRPYLDKKGINYQAVYTKHTHHCTEIVRKLTNEATEERTLVILGGDGSINEAVNGYVPSDLCTLAYIPIGSSNDFARGLGIKGSPIQVLENILNKAHEVHLDCGMVKAPNQEGRKFIVSSGIGFDAAVTHEASDSPLKKILNKLHLGKLVYVCIAIKQLYSLELQKATLILDGEKVIHVDRFYFAASQNLPYEGGGFMFAPGASPTDGILNVCLAHTLPKLKVLCLLPTAFPGKHLGFKGIELHPYKHMRVILEKPFCVHTDGETYGHYSDIEVTNLPGFVRFVY